MPWWSWRRAGRPAVDEPETGGERARCRARVRVERAGRSVSRWTRRVRPTCRRRGAGRSIAPVTLRRVGEALDLLDIRYLADGDGSLLAHVGAARACCSPSRARTTRSW